MKAKALSLLLSVACLAFPSIAAAHHSAAAEFDSSRHVALSGIVTKVEWANPHTFFHVDVKDPKTGSIVRWTCELGSPNMLVALGWTHSTLKVGMTVNFAGTQARDGSRKVNARELVADGIRLVVWPSQLRAH